MELTGKILRNGRVIFLETTYSGSRSSSFKSISVIVLNITAVCNVHQDLNHFVLLPNPDI